MGLFEKIKCYTSSALVFWLIYHVLTTCPLCCPLPYEGTGNEDTICKYTHTGYSYIKPYTDPALEYYQTSPIKPYVDDSIIKINEFIIEPYGPIVKEQIEIIYNFASNKIHQLKERLDDDSLSNTKIEDILIPAEEELKAFIGKPDINQEKTIEPVTPNDDEIEPTPIPTTKESNTILKTDVTKSTDESIVEPAEEIIPVAEETEIPVAVTESESSNGKFEESVDEVKVDIEQIAAEVVIEAAEAVGEAL